MRTKLLVATLLVVCAVTYWGTLTLPRSTFEPLGSAAFPRALAVLIALLSLVLLVRPEEKPTVASPDLAADGDAAPKPTPWMAVGTALATVVFAAVFQMRIVNFGIMVTVFLALVISFLNRFNPRMLLPTLIIAVIFGFGIDFIFTSIFVVDLP